MPYSNEWPESVGPASNFVWHHHVEIGGTGVALSQCLGLTRIAKGLGIFVHFYLKAHFAHIAERVVYMRDVAAKFCYGVEFGWTTSARACRRVNVAEPLRPLPPSGETADRSR